MILYQFYVRCSSILLIVNNATFFIVVLCCILVFNKKVLKTDKPCYLKDMPPDNTPILHIRLMD